MQNFTPSLSPKETLLALHDDEVAASADRHRPSKSSPHDEVHDRVRLAEEQLRDLQQKRQLLEQQKQELEQLSAEQRKFSQGKTRMQQRLKAVIPALETEADHARRRAEFLSQMQDVFAEHHKVLDTMNADDWDEKDVRIEVQRCLDALQDTQKEFEQFEKRLAQFDKDGNAAFSHARLAGIKLDQSEFTRCMKLGFAFAIPMMIFVAITLLLTYIVTSA